MRRTHNAITDCCFNKNRKNRNHAQHSTQHMQTKSSKIANVRSYGISGREKTKPYLAYFFCHRCKPLSTFHLFAILFCPDWPYWIANAPAFGQRFMLTWILAHSGSVAVCLVYVVCVSVYVRSRVCSQPFLWSACWRNLLSKLRLLSKANQESTSP